MNRKRVPSSRTPATRTPVQRSTPNGRTAQIAATTFTGLSPPARKVGTETAFAIRALRDQSCVRPVPPSSLTERGCFPESSSRASTCWETRMNSATDSSPVMWTTWTSETPARGSRSSAYVRSGTRSQICTVLARHPDTADLDSRHRTSAAGLGAQLRPTAPTASAGTEAPAARTLPRLDWTALLGVSCKPLAARLGPSV